jgi:hypothetical protein
MMTDDMIGRRALVERSADADILRDMIGVAAEGLMEMKLGASTGLARGPDNRERIDQQKGDAENNKHNPQERQCGHGVVPHS